MAIDIVRNTIINFLVDNSLPYDARLERIYGGANNKIFRVSADGRDFLLKVYFEHPDDSRQRLKSEFSFCRFAWARGLRALPEPLACDYQNHLALYEFIEGRHLKESEIDRDFILRALAFYRELNKYKQCPDAQQLGLASEAHFSIGKHLECVEGRLEKLRGIERVSQADSSALDFVNTDLSEQWRRLRDSVIKEAKSCAFGLYGEIENDDRCLSPSDFGFHNAILTDKENLRFIDFEYAGWDDPAKLVCDFFCQPKIAAPNVFFDFFADAVVSNLKEPRLQRKRVGLLFPVYQIKWCCIVMNEFLRGGSKRRDFASDILDKQKLEETKIAQLNKARRILESLRI